MAVVLNTSHPLYSALTALLFVDEDNTIKDLKDAAVTATLASGVTIGAGTYGRHVRVYGASGNGLGATLSKVYGFGTTGTPNGTVFMALNTCSAASGARGGLLAHTTSANTLPGILVNTSRQVGVAAAATATATLTSGNIATGAHTITLTRTAQTAHSIMLDGDAEIVSGAQLGSTSINNGFNHIGGWPGGGYGFATAEIVYIAVFNRELTSAESKSLFDSLTGSNAFGLVAITSSPTLTSPSASATGATTGSGSVNTNQGDGTLYYLVNTSSTATVAAVKAGASQAVSSTGTKTVSLTGLTAGTTYYLHFVHTNGADADSTVSTASFATPTPASATTLSGPSGGQVSAASGAFTVGANGAITGTVTVTPSDGGGGGSFSPTSVAISAVTPTATFTYTPASAGAKTISISDDGSLTDATPLTYTATLAAGTLTSSPLKNNTGTLLAAAPFEAYVNNPTTGALVVKKTGLTSNGSGVVSFSDGSVVAATSYRVVWRRTDTGAEGLETLTGA